MLPQRKNLSCWRASARSVTAEGRRAAASLRGGRRRMRSPRYNSASGGSRLCPSSARAGLHPRRRSAGRQRACQSPPLTARRPSPRWRAPSIFLRTRHPRHRYRSTVNGLFGRASETRSVRRDARGGGERERKHNECLTVNIGEVRGAARHRGSHVALPPVSRMSETQSSPREVRDTIRYDIVLLAAPLPSPATQASTRCALS
jgi:hypothetical protein